MKPTPSDAVRTWAAGFAGAAVVQGLLPRAFAHGTGWGHNEGWQREIAIWNVGVLTMIWRVRQPRADVDRALTTGFSVLSALFAINHLAAAVSGPRSWGNWLGAGANGVGLGVGLAALLPAGGRSASAS